MGERTNLGQFARVPVEERFWGYVEKTPTCWRWTGWLNPDGYGSIQESPTNGVRGKAIRVHRFAYELLVGPIPDGLDLDHTCHTEDLTCLGGSTCPHRQCVNPDHLEPVTGKENNLRGRTFGAANLAKEACTAGHPFDEANTYTTPDGRRQCRLCNRERTRRYRERQAAQGLGR